MEKIRIYLDEDVRPFGIILSDQVSFSLLLRRLLKFLAAISMQEEIKGKLIWLSDYK